MSLPDVTVPVRARPLATPRRGHLRASPVRPPLRADSRRRADALERWPPTPPCNPFRRQDRHAPPPHARRRHAARRRSPPAAARLSLRAAEPAAATLIALALRAHSEPVASRLSMCAMSWAAAPRHVSLATTWWSAPRRWSPARSRVCRHRSMRLELARQPIGETPICDGACDGNCLSLSRRSRVPIRSDDRRRRARRAGPLCWTVHLLSVDDARVVHRVTRRARLGSRVRCHGRDVRPRQGPLRWSRPRRPGPVAMVGDGVNDALPSTSRVRL